jgi:hypothetical protein
VGRLADWRLDRRLVGVVGCHSDRGCRWLLSSGGVGCVDRVLRRRRLFAITGARRRAVGLLRRVLGCRRLFAVPSSRRRLLAVVGARGRRVGGLL